MPASLPTPAEPLGTLPKGVIRGRTLDRPDERIPSGQPALDRLLGGGFPRGRLSEVYGAPSSGRTSLAHRLLADATARGEIAALVDPGDRFDPRSAAEAGADLARLLWVRPRDEREALRASEILLGTRGIAIVLLDLADGIPSSSARRLDSAWPRLARQAEASNVALLLLGRERLAGGATALSVALHRGRPLWPSHALRHAIFAGIASRAEVVRRRGGAADSRRIELRA